MIKTHDIIYGSVLAAAASRRLAYGLAPPTARRTPKARKATSRQVKKEQILQSMKNISVDSDRIWYNITTKDFHMNSHSNKLGISRKGDNERRGRTGETGETSGTSGTGTGRTGETSGTGGTGGTGACHARLARPASHSGPARHACHARHACLARHASHRHSQKG